jgi:hypothetical protein
MSIVQEGCKYSLQSWQPSTHVMKQCKQHSMQRCGSQTYTYCLISPTCFDRLSHLQECLSFTTGRSSNMLHCFISIKEKIIIYSDEVKKEESNKTILCELARNVCC